MGERGPVPKRSSERRRRNKTEVEVASAPSATANPIAAPPPEGHWHDLAREWYEALAASGQARFYEASDWAMARVWAELLSRELMQARPSAKMVEAWSSGAAELLTTEGARRRVRLELQREEPQGPTAGVIAMDDYRAVLGG